MEENLLENQNSRNPAFPYICLFVEGIQAYQMRTYGNPHVCIKIDELSVFFSFFENRQVSKTRIGFWTLALQNLKC